MAARKTLPAEATSFVGRERDLRQIERAFAEGARLGPLSLPGDGVEVARSEAVQLFVERALAVRPSFAATAENAGAIAAIVEQLDGLPLAIDASFALLSPAEQRAFEQVSIFRGGFDLEAAEVVVALGAAEATPLLDVLQALVEKSLLSTRSPEAAPDEVRFGHEPGGQGPRVPARGRHDAEGNALTSMR